MADQYCNLGNLHLLRGDLEGAEALYSKSLVLNEVLYRKAEIATNVGNLGILLRKRGDLRYPRR